MGFEDRRPKGLPGQIDRWCGKPIRWNVLSSLISACFRPFLAKKNLQVLFYHFEVQNVKFLIKKASSSLIYSIVCYLYYSMLAIASSAQSPAEPPRAWPVFTFKSTAHAVDAAA